jgi:hypothetical protein
MKLAAKKGQNIKVNQEVFKKCSEFWRRLLPSPQLECLNTPLLESSLEQVATLEKNFKDLKYATTTEMSSHLRLIILAMTRAAAASVDLYKSVVEFNIYADSLTDELQIMSKDIYTIERQ